MQLALVDGNATPGAVLYAHTVLGAALLGRSVFNIVGNGMTICYDPALAVNDYLLGGHWNLLTGGWLAPAPVPLPPAARLLAAPVAQMR
ncbi:MAG: hypothetical protein HY749_21220 [Gammaproteobacteria bacterium]|nr:hypothetical protein [Gammaproteobacteria bacterium]